MDADLDLLARRRLETTSQIHRAALDLFEAQGLRETTVQQIAQRAGISSRTFFRYFPVKEGAAFPVQARLLASLGAVALDADASDLGAVLSAFADALDSAIQDAGDPDRHEHRRIAQLLAREPELETYVGAQDAEISAAVRARIGEARPDVDGLDAQVVGALVAALWRVTWDRWGAEALAERAVEPVDVFRDARAAFSRTLG